MAPTREGIGRMRQSFRAAACMLAVGFATALGMTPAAAASCPNPRQMDGFKTCADVAKAEQEGEVVFYTTDPPQATTEVMNDFMQAFPKIKATFLRLQAGNLFQRLMSERQAKTNVADVMSISEMTFATDLQKRGGYMLYELARVRGLRPEYKSQPEGYFGWGALIVAGLAYNPKLVPANEAPEELAGCAECDLQGRGEHQAVHLRPAARSWYQLRKLYGEDYWTKFATQQPRGFDSYVQQFDRMVNGQDKLVHTAQYSAYLQLKAKGADLEFVFPTDGVRGGPVHVRRDRGCPAPGGGEADAGLVPGQAGPGITAEPPFPVVSPHRHGAAPGGIPTSQMKVLLVDDWDAYLKSRPQFVREWDKMTGLR